MHECQMYVFILQRQENFKTKHSFSHHFTIFIDCNESFIEFIENDVRTMQKERNLFALEIVQAKMMMKFHFSEIIVVLPGYNW